MFLDGDKTAQRDATRVYFVVSSVSGVLLERFAREQLSSGKIVVIISNSVSSYLSGESCCMGRGLCVLYVDAVFLWFVLFL